MISGVLDEASVKRRIDTLTGDLRPTAGRKLSAREVGGFVITRAQYQSRARTPWHSHALTSVEVVLDGGYCKRTKRSDYECTPGALTVEPAGHSHAGIYGPSGWCAVIVEITPSRYETVPELAPVLSQPLQERDSAARVLGRRAWVELQKPDAVSALVLEGIALELIGIAGRRQMEMHPRTSAPLWLRLATERLRDEFRSKVRLSELAASVGVHPMHLARAFRAREGCSIGEYVRRQRIEWAARELTANRAPIAEVAQGAGFYDQSHFARVFKEHIGLTPAQYRNHASHAGCHQPLCAAPVSPTMLFRHGVTVLR